MPEDIDDIEIQYWNGLRNGDPDSLSGLYNRYFKLLYNYGRKIRAEKKPLEDAIHDVFVDLWRFRKNLSATTSVRFYLYRSLRRRLVRNHEAGGYVMHAGVIREDLLEGVPCMEHNIIDNEIQHHRVTHLKNLLNDLSPRQYEAMILRFYDELSFEEIASILNINEQSARNLVQRGLAQLKQHSKLLLVWAVLVAI